MPSESTILPLSVTLRCRISVSTARREPKPAAARYLLMRMSSASGHDVQGTWSVQPGALRGDRVQALAQVLDVGLAGQRQRRQVVEPVLEPEDAVEHLGRAVEHGATALVVAPGLLDHAALEQAGDGAVGRDAADARDLGTGDRLQVGDHGERLERRGRELRDRARAAAAARTPRPSWRRRGSRSRARPSRARRRCVPRRAARRARRARARRARAAPRPRRRARRS